MKRTLLLLIIAIIVLSNLMDSCKRQSNYDCRLLAVDSIMPHQPDSALQVLTAIDVNRLNKEADRAFYALLMTQARYKNYQVATSDSLINVALNYFSSHRADQEKFTRALIYKGAVMDELGQSQEAMQYYKQAEEAVPANDHFNQGYIKMRMGQLYNDSFVTDSIDVTHFKDAIGHFKLIPDSFYMAACLCQLGSALAKVGNDSASYYLNQAFRQARVLQARDLEMTCLRYIADMKMFSSNQSDVDTAKMISLSVLHDTVRGCTDDNHFLMLAAYSLAKQGKTDSAYYYLGQLSVSDLGYEDQAFYYKCMAAAALSEGDVGRYQHFYELEDHLSDSLVANESQRKLKEVDARYDNEKLKNENLSKRSTIASLVLGLVALASLLGLVVVYYTKNAARRKSQLEQRERDIEHLNDDLERLATQLQAHRAMNISLKQTIRNQIDTYSRLVQEYYQQFTTNPKKFDEIFQKSYNVRQPDGSFWDGIMAYADSISNGFVSHAMSSCPQMTEGDVKFLSLYVCGLPTSVIMICLGHSNLRSTYNKRHKIAQMLGEYNHLDEYIKTWKRLDEEGLPMANE